MMQTNQPIEGGCACRHIRYRLSSKPMWVNCCHCTWCQRESGSAFAINALIEADRVLLSSGEVALVDTPSQSGKGQSIARCPQCHVALWSNYGGMNAIRFVRVGTLDDPNQCPPDIHIYTSTKQAWVELPPGRPCVPAYFKSADYWSQESLERLAKLFASHQ